MVRHTGVVAEAVSSSAVDGDAVHGQGLGSIDGEGLNGRVLDGESVAEIWLAADFLEEELGCKVFLHGRSGQTVSVEELWLSLASV
jgi:hypothetical protein